MGERSNEAKKSKERSKKYNYAKSSNRDILIYSFNLMKSQFKSVCWDLEGVHREGNVKAKPEAMR